MKVTTNQNEIDTISGDELVLFAQNDEPLYRVSQAWVKNYQRKQKKGVYDRELALKGIVNNFVPMVIKAYRKEFGLGKIDKQTKVYIGKELLAYIEADIADINRNESQ